MGGCVAVVVVPWQGWSRGVGQTSVPIENVRRGVFFFSGEGRVGVRFLRVRWAGVQQWYLYQRDPQVNVDTSGGKKSIFFFLFFYFQKKINFF